MPSTFPVEQWSTNPADNDRAGSPFPEGQSAGSINNGSRDAMAAMREARVNAEWFSYGSVAENPTEGHDISWLATNRFKIGGQNVTGIYHVGRRVKIQGSVTGIVYGTISATTFTGGDTDVTVVLDGGSLINEILAVSIGVISAVNRSISGILPIGTRLYFPSATPPPEWDIVTGLNDRFLLIGSSGGTIGGSEFIDGLTVPPHDHPDAQTGNPFGGSVSLGGGPILLNAGDHNHIVPIGNSATLTVVSDGTWRPRFLVGVIAERAR